MERKYIHGFSRVEQARLIEQAEFLEPYVFRNIELDYSKRLLEVGCGVGAQTKILTRRFPKIKVDSVDLSKEQLAVAKKYLKPEIARKQVRLFQQNALELKMKDQGEYDAAFVCWFLEHVPDPLKALKKIRQQLKPLAKIYISEVFNQSLFMEPYSPAYLKYWFEFNDYQWSQGGHPFVGAGLGHLLKEAGYKDIEVNPVSFHFDSREPERRSEFIDYFFKILLSAQDVLLTSGRVDAKLVAEMKHEVEAVKKQKNAVFYYSFMRATAKV